MNYQKLVMQLAKKQKERQNSRICHLPQKYPFAGRVGKVADMMAQFYKAKVELPHEKEDSTVILESVLEQDKIRSAVGTNGDNVQVTFPSEIIVEGALTQCKNLWTYLFSHAKNIDSPMPDIIILLTFLVIHR